MANIELETKKHILTNYLSKNEIGTILINKIKDYMDKVI